MPVDAMDSISNTQHDVAPKPDITPMQASFMEDLRKHNSDGRLFGDFGQFLVFPTPLTQEQGEGTPITLRYLVATPNGYGFIEVPKETTGTSDLKPFEERLEEIIRVMQENRTATPPQTRIPMRI